MCHVLSLLVQHNIQKTVQTLWQQLVAQRRQALEDTVKIDLSVKPAESEVKIDEITPLWEETMLKAWQHYLGLSPFSSRGWELLGFIKPHSSKVPLGAQSLFYPNPLSYAFDWGLYH